MNQSSLGKKRLERRKNRAHDLPVEWLVLPRFFQLNTAGFFSGELKVHVPSPRVHVREPDVGGAHDRDPGVL